MVCILDAVFVVVCRLHCINDVCSRFSASIMEQFFICSIMLDNKEKLLHKMQQNMLGLKERFS